MSEDTPTYGTPPILGYRELTKREVDAVNKMKRMEAEILAELAELSKTGGAVRKRWTAIGRTDIEKAFMAVNRAILTPGSVGTSA